MRVNATALRIAHSALVEPRGRAVPLADAALLDRARLGVLLQGAALLSHLQRAGWHLGQGWRGAGVSPDGSLRVGGAAPGRARALPQERLRDLVAVLFPDGTGGRSAARRVTRELLASWQQALAPIPPDDLVGQILVAAPFLLDPGSAAARRALACEHHFPQGAVSWVAGPVRWRELLLGAAQDFADLERLLASPECGRMFHDGAALRSAGASAGWAATVAATRAQPPTEPEARLALAAALAGLGRYRRALAAIEGLPELAPVGLLRVRCQAELGELAAARETLRLLGRAELDPGELATAAELAQEILAGDQQQLRRWRGRALDLAGGAALWRCQVVAAAGGETALAAAGSLEAARPLLAIPEHAWKWHRVRAQWAAASGDGATALEHLARALRGSRRYLTRAEAGGLWSQMARARTLVETLVSAEHACRHAVRLYRGCDGERRTRGAQYRLAELRLRRGETQGVADLLSSSAAANAGAGDHRAAAFDAILRARFELVRGQPHAALASCREALTDLDRRGLDHGRSELRVLAARALGWLGAREEAAAELATLEDRALATLEREERPAVWALAGDRDSALAETKATSLARLWQAALTGRTAPESAWLELRALERYRSARLVFDLELVAPGVTPLYWLRRAAATLQRVGAESFAVRLEPRRRGGWEALEAYLRSAGDPTALLQLFFAAGYPEARLVLSRGSRAERVLVAGSGGGEELTAVAGGGLLTLRAPLVDPTLRALFALALRDLDTGGARALPTDALRGGLLGDSPKLLAALERVALLAPGELPVLILGETGTGKELLARQVHALSRRSTGQFLPLNCAAVSEHLLLSELFGHARGAFTGAERDRAGVFETARGGTVFLDEIGDLPPNAQGMLLRTLQEGEIRRVGESLPRKIDVRVVAATHRDLPAMVKAGAFRQDLFYRLRGACVALPALRERGDDILLLAEHFLARGPRTARLSARARAALLNHGWPGNVRELRNAVEVAAAIAGGQSIQAEHLDLPQSTPRAVANYHQRVDALRREVITEALAASGGRRAEAARRLGLTRQALSYLLKQLAI